MNPECRKALDVAGGAGKAGTNVHLWELNGTSAQTFIFDEGVITHAISGCCLDVIGGGLDNGANVQLWDPNGTEAQRWEMKPNGNILNPRSNKVLDIAGNDTANGTNLHIWEPKEGLWSQKWTSVKRVYIINPES